MKKLFENLILFLIGGSIYFFSECIFRGYSFMPMFIVGGISFLCIGALNNTVFNWNTPLLIQQFISMLIITSLEFASGMILNVYMGLNMWDYSNQWGNIYGQICPKFMIIWFFVSLIGIILDDIIRWKLFKEERPHYQLL